MVNNIVSNSSKFYSSLYLAIVFIIILYSPSIKNFIPTMAINVLPFFMLIVYILVKPGFTVKLDGTIMSYILLLSLFFILLFLIGLFNSLESFSFLFLLKYLTIWFTMILAALVVTKQSIEYFLYLAIIWGGFMAISVITGFFDLSRIHYLQIGHPIAITLIVSAVFFYSTRSVLSKFLFLSLIFLALTALTSLYGRSPLIFPCIVLSILLMCKVFVSNKVIFVALSTITFTISGFVYNWFLSILPKHIVDRMISMTESFDEEPRFQLWSRALDFILQNPFGYGLESSWRLVGYTPHNFILEILLSSGFLGLIPFIALLVIWLSLGLYIFKIGKFAIAIFGASLYYFLRFQVGGEISSSYDFFILLLLSIFYINVSKKSTCL